MATHSNVLAWRIPGTGEPGGCRSVGSHRVRHDWSDLAAAGKISYSYYPFIIKVYNLDHWFSNCILLYTSICLVYKRSIWWGFFTTYIAHSIFSYTAFISVFFFFFNHYVSFRSTALSLNSCIHCRVIIAINLVTIHHHTDEILHSFHSPYNLPPL